MAIAEAEAEAADATDVIAIAELVCVGMFIVDASRTGDCLVLLF